MKEKERENENQFLKSIFRVAEEVKGTSLTSFEQNKIIEVFNKSNASSAAEKAREAVEQTIQKTIYSVLLEKSASSSLDNLDDLLSQMNTEAEKWNNE